MGDNAGVDRAERPMRVAPRPPWRDCDAHQCLPTGVRIPAESDHRSCVIPITIPV